MAKQRLHKFLAGAGIGSRRRCEEIIAEGHVSVDGVDVREMGIIVDPDVQEIRYNDERIVLEKPIHFVVNKPVGYLSTTADEFGRRTVVSLVKDRHRRRLFTVGRLDEDSEGVIFVTNDGEFANKVAHPRYGLEKTYELKLHGYLDDAALDRVRKGVWMSTGKSQEMYVRVIKRSQQFTQVRVVLHEGKNRQLRRIFAKVGHAVARLQRTRIGPIDARGLKKGMARRLTKPEVESILRACEAKKAEGGAVEKGLRSSDSERYAGEKQNKARQKKIAAGGPKRGPKPSAERAGSNVKKPQRPPEGGRSVRRERPASSKPTPRKSSGRKPAAKKRGGR